MKRNMLHASHPPTGGQRIPLEVIDRPGGLLDRDFIWFLTLSIQHENGGQRTTVSQILRGSSPSAMERSDVTGKRRIPGDPSAHAILGKQRALDCLRKLARQDLDLVKGHSQQAVLAKRRRIFDHRLQRHRADGGIQEERSSGRAGWAPSRISRVVVAAGMFSASASSRLQRSCL